MRHWPLTLPALCTAVLLPSQLFAQADPAKIDALFEAMALPELLEVMQLEGFDYGALIAADLFPDSPTAEWTAVVEDIYAIDTLTNGARASFGEALDGADLDSISAFFTGEVGQQVIELELSARRALMDEDIEEASKAVAALALQDETPRAALVTEFVETNDLVEANVVGAMNANFAFYTGLIAGGGLPQALSEEDILRDVWSQEPEIRQNTSEWIYSYLLLAYQPLSDEDLQAYIAFSETQAGKDINIALFEAFDAMFISVSKALGAAASGYMVGQDL